MPWWRAAQHPRGTAGLPSMQKVSLTPRAGVNRRSWPILADLGAACVSQCRTAQALRATARRHRFVAGRRKSRCGRNGSKCPRHRCQAQWCIGRARTAGCRHRPPIICTLESMSRITARSSTASKCGSSGPRCQTDRPPVSPSRFRRRSYHPAAKPTGCPRDPSYTGAARECPCAIACAIRRWVAGAMNGMSPRAISQPSAAGAALTPAARLWPMP